MGVFRSRTTKQTKSGSKKSYVCKTWRARAKDPVTGERIEKAGFRTKTEGQAWKFSIEKGEGRVQAARSIPNLIDEFRAHQQDNATSEAQIKLTVGRIDKVLSHGGFASTQDLTEDRLRGTLARTYESINSDQTKRHHQAAVRQLCLYLVRKGRLPSNPVANVPAQKVRKVVHPRRVFAASEIARLHEVTRLQPTFRGLSGEQRDLVYILALGTGLRASEIAALRPVHLALGAKRPHIHLPGSEMKNDDRRYWESCGGVPTRKSYPECGDDQLIDPDHLAFLKSRCRDYFETDRFLFIHANYYPNRPMPEQTGQTLRWETMDPHRMGRHYSGKTAVVGHTTRTDGHVLDLGFLVMIDTGTSMGGWLTALEVNSGEIVQTNQQGEIRRSRRTATR